MPNAFAGAGMAVGKMAVNEAIDVGKEAFAASRAQHLPFSFFLKKKAAERVKDALNEGTEVGRYLTKRPKRAFTLAVSAAVAVAAYLTLRAERA